MPRTLRHCLLAIPCLLLALGAPARADVDEYRLDPVHTRVLVAIDHAGFSKALGTLSGATGTLLFDPDDWRSAQMEVSLPLTRLDFGDDEWNRATLADRLLDAGTHPLATFTSTRVEPVDERRAIVYGLLSLRGVEREVALDVVLNAAKRHPLPPFRRTVGFSASATLSRADFGITAWKRVIGDAVELRIEAEATRDRHAGDDAPAAHEDAPVDTADEAAPEPAAAAEPLPAPEPSPPPEPEPVP